MRICTILFIFLLLGGGCKNQRDYPASDPQLFLQYIAGFTTIIDNDQKLVRIRLAKPTEIPVEKGMEADPLLLKSFPEIPGKLFWENPQTLAFLPSSKYEYGKSYLFTLDLVKLFPKENSISEPFRFHVFSREITCSLAVTGISPEDPEKPHDVSLTGRLTTSSAMEQEQVEKMVQAFIGNNSLSLSWIPTENPASWLFKTAPVSRGDEEKNIDLRWDGGTVGSSFYGEKRIPVAPKNVFKLVDYVTESDLEVQEIKLTFSDALPTEFMADGFFELQGFSGNLRYQVKGSQLQIFPSKQINGVYTLKIFPGLRSAEGINLSEEINLVLHFDEVKPTLRLLGEEVIMTGEEGMLFPFEAIGLNAVDIEIQKVFSDNILQFFQLNDWDGGLDMNRVGELILQKKIPLNQLNPGLSTTGWAQFALDLSSLIEVDEGAIYQVSIGFRPGYAAFPCADSVKIDVSREEVKTSMWDNYYGVSGYYPGYRWEQRDDPCYPAYYNYERFIRRNVFVSNIGLLAKGEPGGGLLVASTDLLSAEPLSNVRISLYSYQQQLIVDGKTNDEGMVFFTEAADAAFVVAEKRKEKAYLRIQDGESLSLSRFDAGGVEVSGGLKGFFYGEREVWQPGDSIFLHFILEDKYNMIPANQPLQMTIQDPLGKVRFEKMLSDPIGPIYACHFQTNQAATSGNWKVTVQAGATNFTHYLAIESIKPNRLSIDLKFNPESLQPAHPTISGRLSVSWLHGAPGRNLHTKSEWEAVSIPTVFSNFPTFFFDDASLHIKAEKISWLDAPLDDKGNALFSFPLDFQSGAPGSLELRFFTRAYEKNGSFSRHFTSVPYLPYTHYVGLEINKDDDQVNRISLESGGMVKMITVNAEGRKAPGRQLQASLYKANWRWWWDSGSAQERQFLSGSNLDILQSEQVETGKDGNLDYVVKVPEWGRYFIRVCDLESGHCAGTYFYAGFPWAEDGPAGKKTAESFLHFSADKNSCEAGEAITLLIPAGNRGRCLVSLESGTKVLESKWYDVKKGDNEFTFTTRSEMAPTVYAHVTLLQPLGQSDNDLPIRLYGVIPLEVFEKESRLAPNIKAPEQLEPGQTFSVSISENKSRAMSYSLAIVEEGLLNVTGFKTPDPWSAFFAKEALGIKTWDMYDQVMGSHSGHFFHRLSIGGDGVTKDVRDIPRTNRFDPVVLHKGPFFLEKGEKETHTFTLPNYIGAVRVMVIAASNQAYGSVEKRIEVKKPLMVLADSPGFLGTDESLSLPVTVFSSLEGGGSVAVEIMCSSDLLSVVGPTKKMISINGKGEETTNFSIQTGEKSGIASIQIRAENSKDNATYEMDLAVRNPTPVITNVDQYIIQPDSILKGHLSLPGIPGTNELVLEGSSFPPIEVDNRLRFLAQATFGSLSSRVSAAFPLLFIEKLTEQSADQQSKNQRKVLETIRALQEIQLSNGGFPAWPGGKEAEPWETSFAGHFLLEARAMGYPVPSFLIENWLLFQEKSVRFWVNLPGELERSVLQELQAYRLYSLALANKPDLGGMNRMRESSPLTETARWMLVASYARIGQLEASKRLADVIIESPQSPAVSFGSYWQRQAMIMESLLLVDKKDEALAVFQRCLKELNQSPWLAPEEIAFALLGLSRFAEKNNPTEPFRFTFQTGKQPVWNAEGKKWMFHRVLNETDLSADGAFYLENTGSNPLFVRFVKTGKPKRGKEKLEAENLKMLVTYRDLDGAPLAIDSIPQGTEFIAEISLENSTKGSERAEECVLEYILPAGWELIDILNPETETTPVWNTEIKYQQLQHDRIKTFLNLEKKGRVRFRMQAIWPGTFYLPLVQCSAVQNKDVFARWPGQMVHVIQNAK